MATRDDAHGKRCASVRFPVLASQPVSKARKAKARPIPKLGRHSSGQARVTLNGKVHYREGEDTNMPRHLRLGHLFDYRT